MSVIKTTAAVTLASIFALSFNTAAAHSGATGVVKERMDGFKAAKRSMKSLKSAVRGSDFATIETQALSLSSWFADLERYFPEGSNAKPSEALDIIWQDFDSFSAIAQRSRDASAALLKAAQQADKSAAAEAFSELGASCKACHDDFRE